MFWCTQSPLKYASPAFFASKANPIWPNSQARLTLSAGGTRRWWQMSPGAVVSLRVAQVTGTGLGGYNVPGMANSPKAARFGGWTHKAGCWKAKRPKMGRDRWMRWAGDSPLPYWDLRLGENKPRMAWIRVGSWPTTSKICLMMARGIVVMQSLSNVVIWSLILWPHCLATEIPALIVVKDYPILLTPGIAN